MITYPERLRGSALPIARGARVIAGDWSVLRVTRQIGFGELDFERAVARVMTWQMHRDAGVGVRQIRPGKGGTDSPSRARVGDVVELRLGLGFVGVSARCTVVECWTPADPSVRLGSRTERCKGIQKAVRKRS
ncbi:MAG: DUF1990 family protein [Actinomycetes bacterium]